MHSTLSLAAICFLASFSQVSGHSWVEEATVVAPNGTFVGTPGFPRGKVDRSAPGWGNDDMTFLVPPNDGGNVVKESQAMCQYPNAGQEANKPVLTAAAGDRIALRYLENGHVTKPDISGIKPKNSGTVFVYGTTQPLASDKFLAIHKQWNAEGTGGDKRGVLLAAQPFDDGQCYEANGSPIALSRQSAGPKEASATMGQSLWCQSDLTLPEDVKGTYTLYWVWDWPTLDQSGAVVLNESYTTCMDLDISSSSASSQTGKKAVSFAKGQDLNFAGIASELTNNFNAATTGFAAPSSGSGSPPAASTSVSAPPSASASGSPAASKSKSKSTPSRTNSAGANEVTVTVTATATPEVQYITVTATVTAGQPAASGSPAGGDVSDTKPTSAQAQPSKSTGTGTPKVQPFLGAAGEPASSPTPRQPSYTNGTQAGSGSPKLRIRHARRHRVANLFS